MFGNCPVTGLSAEGISLFFHFFHFYLLNGNLKSGNTCQVSSSMSTVLASSSPLTCPKPTQITTNNTYVSKDHRLIYLTHIRVKETLPCKQKRLDTQELSGNKHVPVNTIFSRISLGAYKEDPTLSKMFPYIEARHLLAKDDDDDTASRCTRRGHFDTSERSYLRSYSHKFALHSHIV